MISGKYVYPYDEDKEKEFIDGPNWHKCDKRDCNLVAWYELTDTQFNTSIVVCEKHMEELKVDAKKWKIDTLGGGK